MTYKTRLKTLWRMAHPRTYYAWRLHQMQSHGPDVEMRLLPVLARPDKCSLDIGAENGVYSAHLLRCSSSVMAFDPRQTASEFRALAKSLKSPVQWESVALSDRSGKHDNAHTEGIRWAFHC